MVSSGGGLSCSDCRNLGPSRCRWEVFVSRRDARSAPRAPEALSAQSTWLRRCRARRHRGTTGGGARRWRSASHWAPCAGGFARGSVPVQRGPRAGRRHRAVSWRKAWPGLSHGTGSGLPALCRAWRLGSRHPLASLSSCLHHSGFLDWRTLDSRVCPKRNRPHWSGSDSPLGLLALNGS